MEIPSSLIDKLNRARRIALLFHKSPDGDAVGSALALKTVLEKKGKQVIVISPDAIPDYLQWLPGSRQILRADTSSEQARQTLENADLIFMLDHNKFERTGKFLAAVLEQLIDQKTMVMLDHHLNPDKRIHYIFSDPSKASTAEIVYEFIQKAGLGPLDKDAATQLYTGILTDTGSFKFDKTTGQTHRIIADLIEHGAENAQIHSNIYDVNSFDKIQLLAEALKRMKIIEDCGASYIALDKETLEKYNYQPGMTEGIVNYGLSLENIHLTALITEKPDENKIRLSLRSKGKFNVNDFSAQYFGGGGHQNAAGGNFYGSLEEAVQAFEKAVKEHCNEIKNATE